MLVPDAQTPSFHCIWAFNYILLEFLLVNFVFVVWVSSAPVSLTPFYICFNVNYTSQIDRML